MIFGSIIKAHLTKLPSKKIIWLVIFLVLLTLGILWYVGYQDKKEKEVKRAQYLAEIIEKEKGLEKVVAQEMVNPKDDKITLIPKPAPLKISSSTDPMEQQIKGYALLIKQAFISLEEERGNEVGAVISATEKASAVPLSIVTKSRIAHQMTYENIKQISVPNQKELQSRHRQVIYELTGIIAMLEVMENALQEPTKALNYSKSYMTNYKNFSLAVDNLNSFYAEQKITIDKKDLISLYISFK